MSKEKSVFVAVDTNTLPAGVAKLFAQRTETAKKLQAETAAFETAFLALARSKGIAGAEAELVFGYKWGGLAIAPKTAGGGSSAKAKISLA